MISLTICNNTSRTTVNVEDSKTINQILADNNIVTAGCTFHLDGMPLSKDEMDQTIDSLTDADEAMLVVVVAQKAGC